MQKKELATWKIVIVQLLSGVRLCEPMDCSTPGFRVLHHFLELAQTHVHFSNCVWASQVALVVKNPPANAREARGVGSIPRLGRSLGEGNGNSLQYSCLESPMEKGASVHGVTKSWT